MKATATKKLDAGKIWLTGLIGFLVGILTGAAYLLSGGEYLINIPRWASIVFYPGFFAGRQLYDLWHPDMGACAIFGVLAVGLTYGLVAASERWIWLTVRWRRSIRS